MRFTAKERLETWTHISRVQSDEETYGIERTVVGSVVAGVTADRCGQCGACDRSVVSVAMGDRETGDMEMMGNDIVDLLRLTAGGNECSYAAQVPARLSV